MSQIQAILFDLGGVLLQMGDITPRLQLSESIGIPLSQMYELVFWSPSAQSAVIGEKTIKQHWQWISQALNINPDDIPAMIEQFWSTDCLNEGLVLEIESLKAKYKIGLLSNAYDNLRQVLHERFPIASLFDEMIISAEVGLAKPNPHIYRLALKRMDVQPAEAVFIDDRAENIDVARAEGMEAIQYLDNRQVIGDLDRLLGDSSTGES